MNDPVEDLVTSTKQCLFRPRAFFVSWNGVLTLAYSGYPPPLDRLKTELSSVVRSLPAENPGSLWPKTTLASLRDGIRLTPEQLSLLTDICKTISLSFTDHTSPIKVDRLSLVVYQSRSLENLVTQKVMALALPVDASPPAESQIQNVEKVLKQADEDGYWFYASKDGNRESHYLKDALGATLVHHLNGFQTHPEIPGSKLLSLERVGMRWFIIELYSKFKEEVERKLPGLYHWFNKEALHVTIRGIIN